MGEPKRIVRPYLTGCCVLCSPLAELEDPRQGLARSLPCLTWERRPKDSQQLVLTGGGWQRSIGMEILTLSDSMDTQTGKRSQPFVGNRPSMSLLIGVGLVGNAVISLGATLCVRP